MTVKQLIQMLSIYDSDMPVIMNMTDRNGNVRKLNNCISIDYLKDINHFDDKSDAILISLQEYLI